MIRVASFVVVLGSVVVACTPSASHCVTGMAVECSCSGALHGTQVCQADGTFSACECGAVDGGAGDGGTDAATIADVGVDAVVEIDGGTDAATVDVGNDAFAPHLYYAGRVDGIGPVWGSDSRAAGATGLDAGANVCRAAVPGSDHPCDYEELLLAAEETLFQAIPMGTTGWVQRTTTVLVGGTPSAPGPGGNCNNWNYATNHIGDGEYVTFDTTGTPTYHLDNDTVYDPSAPGVHDIAGDLQCGGVTRAILCCNAL